MTDTEMAVLDREKAIELSMCPMGRIWKVGYDNGKNLYFIGNEKDDPYITGAKLVSPPNCNMPRKYLEGWFTKPANAEEEINKFLESIWDENDEKVKRAPAKERRKQKLQEEVKD